MASNFKVKLAKGILDFTPKFMATPIALMPFPVKAAIIERMLKLILSQQQQDDELDFLQQKFIGIKIPDLCLNFQVSFNCNHWNVTEYFENTNNQPEVTFSASSSDLILIAAGKEDPDTLFFQRKLNIEGDTELGLEVKNLLLSIEFQSLPKPINLSLAKLAEALVFLQHKSAPQLEL